VEALGAVYFTNSLDLNGDNYPVVAIDVHTGVVRSQSAPVSNPMSSTGYTPPVFDPVNELIYVGITQQYDSGVTSIGPGKIIALDARDLSKVVWSFNTPGFVNNALTVIGMSLIAGDLAGNLYLFDTVAALANPSNVAPAAQWSLPVSAGGQDVWSISEVIANGDSYVMAVWDLTVQTVYLAQFDATTPQPGGLNLVTVFDTGQSFSLPTDLLGQLLLATPPIVQQRDADGTPLLTINVVAQVLQVRLTDGSVVNTFQLPPKDDGASAFVLGGLTLDADNSQLWFGDNYGRVSIQTCGKATALPGWGRRVSIAAHSSSADLP